MSEKHDFSPFEFDRYSTNTTNFFTRMNKLRNDLKLKRRSHNLSEEEQTKLLIKLDILIKDDNSINKSIKDYFDEEINEAKDMNETFKVYKKYDSLLKDCYKKNPYEILKEINMEKKRTRLIIK